MIISNADWSMHSVHVEARGHRTRTISATISLKGFLPAIQRRVAPGHRGHQEALWRLVANILPVPRSRFTLRRHGKWSASGPAFRRAMIWERIAGRRMLGGMRLAESTGRLQQDSPSRNCVHDKRHHQARCMSVFWNHTHRGRAHYLQHTHASSKL